MDAKRDTWFRFFPLLPKPIHVLSRPGQAMNQYINFIHPYPYYSDVRQKVCGCLFCGSDLYFVLIFSVIYYYIYIYNSGNPMRLCIGLSLNCFFEAGCLLGAL